MSRAEKVAGLLILAGLIFSHMSAHQRLNAPQRLDALEARIDELEDQLARSAFVTRAPATTTAARED